MNERTCVVCRKRRRPSDLLAVNRQGDRIAFGRPASGRGSWICPECVSALAKSRFGRGATALEEVRDSARAGLLRDVERAFERARSAGVLESGRFAVARCADAAFVLVSLDAGNVARIGVPTDVPVVRLPWSTEETGRRLGRGPRSVLAARRSRVSADLLARLRRFGALG